jgi:D-lactate dehydrogenase (cytochrome)
MTATESVIACAAPPATGRDVPLRMLRGEQLRALAKYLHDESRSAGHAEAVAFPTSLESLSKALEVAADEGLDVTVSGARTGIAGGAVPTGGMVVSLERMNRFLGLREGGDGELLLKCQAGVLLSEIHHAVGTGTMAEAAAWPPEAQALAKRLRSENWFFPPDPTETGATLGGMVACNASGAHTFLYGPTRPYIHSLAAVLADGSVVRIERGRVTADGHRQLHLATPEGEVRTFQVPTYRQPATKNAAGYYSADTALDAVDLFIGSEGTLGVVAEVEIRLLPAPETHSAQVVFWPDEASALRFVRVLREEREALRVEAIEYFDDRALDFIRRHRAERGASSGVPACLPDAARCGIYLDMGLPADGVLGGLRRLARMVAGLGGDPALSWSAHAKSERESLRLFRHALPEAVNARIAAIRRQHPEVTKLGTDMAVPDDCLENIMSRYRESLAEAGLEYVIFGHIGDNHLHVNILPRNPRDYQVGKQLYLDLAGEVVAMGGSPAAEHGIGKLKIPFLEILLGTEGVEQMRRVKLAFDPQSRLGRGNLFRTRGQR